MNTVTVLVVAFWEVVASARPVPKRPAQIAAVSAIKISEIFMVAPSAAGGIPLMVDAPAATGIRGLRDECSVLFRRLELLPLGGDARCCELVGGEVEVGERVGGGHLGPDPRGAAWHDGEREADRVDAEIDEPARERGGGDLVADHHRHDRVLAGKDVEAELGHAGPEVGGVLAQRVAQLRGGLDQLERLDAGRCDRRGDAVGEQVRTGALAEELDDLAPARDVAAARAADRLAEGPGQDVDALDDAVMLRRAATA